MAINRVSCPLRFTPFPINTLGKFAEVPFATEGSSALSALFRRNRRPLINMRRHCADAPLNDSLSLLFPNAMSINSLLCKSDKMRCVSATHCYKNANEASVLKGNKFYLKGHCTAMFFLSKQIKVIEIGKVWVSKQKQNLELRAANAKIRQCCDKMGGHRLWVACRTKTLHDWCGHRANEAHSHQQTSWHSKVQHTKAQTWVILNFF